MTERLKRWESPRRQGRNDKGKGGSARARQLRKQQQMLRKKLNEGQKADSQNQQEGRESSSLPSFFAQLPDDFFLIGTYGVAIKVRTDLTVQTTTYQ